MIDLSAEQINIIINILQHYVPQCEVRVFGSRINGKSRKYSDLDLIVYRDENTPREIISDLIDAFQESDLPFRVDVLDYATVAPHFKTIIDECNEIILTNQSTK